ncbi:MAG TPA: response regulator transcription factor [Chitinophagales bacterium]|nr:response regulator transcription factor [Chitinophagales bacterium]
MKPSLINVAIVEDDDEIRNSMQEFLSTTNDLYCVAAFANAEDIVKEFRGLNVDVVVMDITLPGMSGIQCVTQLKPIKPQVQFLMCTSHGDAEKTFDSLCAGATGYLLKNSSPQELFDAIRDVFNGGSPMSAPIARLVTNSFIDKNKNQKLFETFTTREQEILTALAKGYSYKEIADRLLISIETVRTYLRKIYENLQVHSKVEALNKVFPKGFE